MIIVVGMGMESGDMTARGKKAVREADELYSRNKTKYRSVALCEQFKDCESYEELDEKIVEVLEDKAKTDKKIVFLSIGDGYSDTAIEKLSRKTEVTVIPGVADCRARGFSGSFATLSAYDIGDVTTIDSRLPLMIYQIDDKFVAGDVKLFLLKFYPADYCVTLFDGKDKRTLPLEDIDRIELKQGSSVYLAEACSLLEKKRFNWSDLLHIMGRLTAPDGCPWDRAQTHESICINMLEEAYEAVDAIKRDDPTDMQEELGDVILQSVFHADICEKEGGSDINDIIDALCKKLVGRHTHIFGTNKAKNADEALVYWEKAKADEKSYSTFKEQIDRLPDTFPATLLLQKFIKKANKNGATITAEQLKTKITERIEKEDKESVGTMLACAVMYAALKGCDPEVALLDVFSSLKALSGGEDLTADILKTL